MKHEVSKTKKLAKAAPKTKKSSPQISALKNKKSDKNLTLKEKTTATISPKQKIAAKPKKSAAPSPISVAKKAVSKIEKTSKKLSVRKVALQSSSGRKSDSAVNLKPKKKTGIASVVETKKPRQLKPESSVKTTKTTVKSLPANVRKSSPKTEKVRAISASEKTKSAKLSVSNKKSETVKIKSVPVKAKSKKDLTVSTKVKTAVSGQSIRLKKTVSTNEKIRKTAARKIKPLTKPEKAIIAAAEAKLQKAKTSQKIILKPVENKVEAVIAPLEVKPRKKKVKPISSAIFRGKKEKYDFKVFPLNELFEQVPAVYIISRRITDKRKKGHHALVCIGQSDSVVDEIKKHRKGKCLRKNNANVISILPETDEQKRLKIETDLKAAHSLRCKYGNELFDN